MRAVLLQVLIAGSFATAAAAQAAPREPPVDSLRAWVRRDSLDARAFFDLGMGYWAKHKFDQADTAFRHALLFAPHYAEPHLALALLPAPSPTRWGRRSRTASSITGASVGTALRSP